MKKGFFLVAASLMLAGGAMAQKDKKVKGSKEAHVTTEIKQPVMVSPAVTTTPNIQQADAAKPAETLWLNETAHDFGKIPQGKPVTTEFELKNTGKDSLDLQSVQASCGCTTPVYKTGKYGPGEKFKITVGYNAANEGAFTKTVTITYNGQQKVVTIGGTVYATPSTPAPENKGVSKVQD